MTNDDEPVIFRISSSASVGDEFSGVRIDEAGNFSAATKGDPRALATILRLVANELSPPRYSVNLATLSQQALERYPRSRQATARTAFVAGGIWSLDLGGKDN